MTESRGSSTPSPATVASANLRPYRFVQIVELIHTDSDKDKCTVP